ncbi:MAG: kelch repeat-containing protein, partial [Verrucomicrobiia bacterium]
VLVAGGADSYLDSLSSAELYDPAAGTWSATGALATGRVLHTATLLPNGKVLVAGGEDGNGNAFNSAELYDVGLGFNSAWQPQIGTATSPLTLGSNLVLTGTQFLGISEGSGGNFQSSSANYPVVQLECLGNEQTALLLSTSWSSNSYTSAAVTGLPPGYALVTMFVNGIPSSSDILNITPALQLPFQITSILPTNAHDLLITWNTAGVSNIVQVTAGTGASGSYSTNGFTDVTNIVVTTATTNFYDVGAATNYPARYYRIRSPQ